jgi:8-oxo-dGTP pyrophosphatase MutT (NUDIX family)
MDYEAFVGHPEAFRRHLGERLEPSPDEFVEQMRFVAERQGAGEPCAASAVLLPLEFDASGRECSVILNKRSAYVQQAGDLCLPGGGVDRRLDRILSRLLVWRILPMERSRPFRKLLRSSSPAREVFLSVIAGVLRESWEEMRLPPWRVAYMGALPTLWMQSFPRVIFPVVGNVRAGWRAHPNWEVESVLRVPLRDFLDPANYAVCRFLVTSPSEGGEGGATIEWEYPCLVLAEGGEEEILWGATFKILMNFLQRVFGLSVDRIKPTRRVTRELPGNYFTGRPRNERKRP